MKNKKNKFLVFFIFNIFLLILILILIYPLSNFLNRIKINDNEFVTNQIISNPNSKKIEIIDRTIKIKLIAKVDDNLNWEFRPTKEIINVKIGENNVVEYFGKNISNKTITSTANFLVNPEAAQVYLVKSECFCFTEQTLKSGESQIFTMVFYIDPSLDSDWYFNNLKELVFTYEFSEYKS